MSIDGTDIATVAGPYVDTPNEWVAPTYAQSLGAGTVRVCSTAGQLTTALAACVRGDIIELTAGNTFTGNFTFPALSGETSGAGWVTVRTSAVASLPAEGTRIADTDIGNMATITNSGGSQQGSGVAYGATRWRFVGIRFLSGTTNGTENVGIFATGYNGADFFSHGGALPGRIVLDRCIVRGRGGVQSDFVGVYMNANRMAILDSVIDTIQTYLGNEAQALCTYMGGSQYTVQNCAISGASQCFIAGGSDSTGNVNPSDFVFRKCYFYKPLPWDTANGAYDGHDRGTIKNHWEIKNGRRVLVEACIFENNWSGSDNQGQTGTSICLTPRNQGGPDTNATCSNVEFKKCIVRNVETAWRCSNTDNLHPSSNLARIWTHDCLFYNIGATGIAYAATQGVQIHFALNTQQGSNPATAIRFTHNTFVTGPIGSMVGYQTVWQEGPLGQLSGTFQDSIIEGGSSGVYEVWQTPTQMSTFDHNATFNETLGSYPAGNWDQLTQAAIGFAGYSSNNYALNANSPYAAGNARQASDGKDLGADIAAINLATANTITGAADGGGSPPPIFQPAWATQSTIVMVEV